MSEKRVEGLPFSTAQIDRLSFVITGFRGAFSGALDRTVNKAAQQAAQTFGRCPPTSDLDVEIRLNTLSIFFLFLCRRDEIVCSLYMRLNVLYLQFIYTIYWSDSRRVSRNVADQWLSTLSSPIGRISLSQRAQVSNAMTHQQPHMVRNQIHTFPFSFYLLSTDPALWSLLCAPIFFENNRQYQALVCFLKHA